MLRNGLLCNRLTVQGQCINEFFICTENLGRFGTHPSYCTQHYKAQKQCTLWPPLFIYSKSHVAKILVQLHPPLSYFQIYIQHSGFFTGHLTLCQGENCRYDSFYLKIITDLKRFFNYTFGFFPNKALHETLQIFWNEFYKLAKVSALKMSKSNKKIVPGLINTIFQAN